MPHAANAAVAVTNDEPRPNWRAVLAPYTRPDMRRSLLDLATSVLPYVALTVGMYLLAGVSHLLVLVLAIPAAGCLLRTFIVFHDCTHGSFMPSKRANAWMGRLAGLLVFSPFQAWRHEHAVHHATSGDLDRRGVGDLPTMTVAEFHAAGRWTQLGYRLFRNPVVMFLTVGPIFSLVIMPRLINLRTARPRNRNSVLLTNLVLVVWVGGLCWLLGWQTFLLVQGPAIMIAGGIGVWLFYVQHQFEDAYWESGAQWDYADAALRGSSYLKLPKVLQFFTGNIGLHHVHHLSSRIPNYNLQRAHDDNPVFHDIPVLTLSDGLRATRLKLFCEQRGRLVTFAEARGIAASPAPASAPVGVSSPSSL